MARRDVAAIEVLGRALIGSGKPLVSTSGTLVMPTGRVTTEQDRPDPGSLAHFRILGEQACLRFAEQDVRCSVVRLAPTVHGPGDYGFVPVPIAAARRNGVSAYVDEGANRWPAVHRHDAARLFRLALEKAPAGSALHGVAENVTLRSIADQIGRTLELPIASLTLEQTVDHIANPFRARVGWTSPRTSADSDSGSDDAQTSVGDDAEVMASGGPQLSQLPSGRVTSHSVRWIAAPYNQDVAMPRDVQAPIEHLDGCHLGTDPDDDMADPATTVRRLVLTAIIKGAPGSGAGDDAGVTRHRSIWAQQRGPRESRWPIGEQLPVAAGAATAEPGPPVVA